jgi:hypothetical protein
MVEAKTIVKNKFWIVEENGHQVGTIQAVPDGVVLVKGPSREKFPSFKILANKHNIKVRQSSKKITVENSVHGYPCDSKPHNSIYDVKSKLPLYTKDSKSRSYYCAGYYLIKFEEAWLSVFCPKKIVLSRNEFLGPFGNKDALNQCLKQIVS